MLRKITAILFLTFASMVMLAFAVVPHHHHQEYICFNEEHCSDELPGIPHSHDTEPVQTNHGCVKNLFQTQISRHQSPEQSYNNGHWLLWAPFLLPDDSSLSLPVLNRQNLSFTLYRKNFRSLYCISQLSGRAPPYSC